MRHIPVSEFKSGKLVQCVAAPEGYGGCVGREGLLYHASEFAGPGVKWEWNMRFTGGAALTPVLEGFVFAAPGSMP